MKLTIKFTKKDGVPVEKEIDIRNPSATVSNLRAAISIHMKLKGEGVHSFKLTSSGTTLSDEKKTLVAAGLKEGSVVVATSKRGREDEEEEAAPPKQAEVAAPSVPVSTSTVSSEKQELLDMGFTDAQATKALQVTKNNKAQAVELCLNGHVSAEGVYAGDAAGSRNSAATAASPRAPEGTGALGHLVDGGPAAGNEDLEDDDDLDDEEDDWFDEEEDIDVDLDEEDMDALEEEEFDEEEEEILGERAELAIGLAQLGNARQMAQRFLANPQETLANIQQTQPELFALIGRNNQFFLDLVNGAANADEDEEDEEEEAGGIPRAFVQAMTMAALSADRRASQPGGVNELRRSGAGNRNNAAPPQLTDEDNAKIDTLVALGFTRDQCVAAYIRSGKNVDQAANRLFENPPS